MKKEIISTIKEQPKTKTGWWAFGLSMGAIASGPILGTMAAFVVPFLGNNLSESVGQIAGFIVMILMMAVLLATLILSIKAYLSGERSWAVLLALTLSILSVCFWIFMLIGELIFPH